MADLSPETRDAVREGAITSAYAVMPIVLATTLPPPETVLDVGCGEGHWLDATAEGLESWGADRHELVGADLPTVRPEHHPSEMPRWHFTSWDAELGMELPEPLGGDYWGLTLCLETAEHLTPEAGRWLVRELCRVSELVVWSAAIPGQGGDGHVNEQWPSYWAEAFDSQAWHLEDPWRSTLWGASDVEPWYQQNLLLAAPGRTDRGAWPPHLVHPAIYLHNHR
jgi:hypothetical protein